MPSVPLDLITPGMTTIADVVNPRGQILVPNGMAITERHMRGLKMWGVDSIEVDAAGLSEDILIQTAPTVPLPTEDELQLFLKTIFRHNLDTLDHPFLSELFSLCEKHFSTTGIPGATLIKLKSTPPDEITERNKNAPSKKKLSTTAEMIKNNSNLASPPDIYAKLMEVMERSGSSSSNIANVISNDPGLSARLLRIVNSAYYSFPSPIETISRAITIVGTDELRHMVLITSIIKNFSASLDGLLDMEQFWKHSIACALFSKQIAKLRNDQNAERFFTTGLLHDIGRLIMYLQMPDEMATVLRNTEIAADVYQEERKQIGFAHTKVGAQLAESWKLSPRQKEAIQFHHTPLGSKRFPIDAAILHVSDVMANALQIGSSGTKTIPKYTVETWELLHLPLDTLGRISQEVQREVTDLINIFYEKTNDRN